MSLAGDITNSKPISVFTFVRLVTLLRIAGLKPGRVPITAWNPEDPRRPIVEADSGPRREGLEGHTTTYLCSAALNYRR